MKQLFIVLSFCTVAYGFLLPGYLTLKDPQPDPYQAEAYKKFLLEEVQAAMNILIRKFHSLFPINKFQQPMPFPWQDLPKLNTGVFTPNAWLKMLKNGL